MFPRSPTSPLPSFAEVLLFFLPDAISNQLTSSNITHASYIVTSIDLYPFPNKPGTAAPSAPTTIIPLAPSLHLQSQCHPGQGSEDTPRR